MKKAMFFLAAAIMLLAFGCKKYTCPETVACSTGYNFVMVGFDSATLRTVTVKVYKADNSFSNPLDSAVILDSMMGRTTNGPYFTWNPLFGTEWDSLLCFDTQLNKYRLYDTSAEFTPYDWEISIPNAGRTFRVSGIKMTGATSQTVETCDNKGNKIGGNCYLHFSSYTVNGKTYPYGGYDKQYEVNAIFLTK
jgi:hypothetical protein